LSDIQASASDDVGVASVVYELDGNSLGSGTGDTYSYTWDTTGASDGSHTITAVATDSADQTAEDTITVTVQNVEPEPTNAMHVDSIDMSFTKLGRRSYTISTTVKVVDENGGAVDGASVQVLLSSGKKATLSGFTDTNGFVTLSYGPTSKSGTYTATVEQVSKTDWTYDSSSNVETTEVLKVK